MSSTTASVSRKVRSRAGCFGADDRQGAEQEGGIGRDHRPPGVLSRSAVVEAEKDQRRQQQARDRGHHRDDCPAAIDKLPDDEIALHLEADDEEEERHQTVVDQVSQRQLEVGTADGDLEGRGPEGFVRRRGKVRPEQRQHCPCQQQGGGGLVGAEVSPHPAQSIDQLLRAPRTSMGGGISVVRACFAPVAPVPDAAVAPSSERSRRRIPFHHGLDALQRLPHATLVRSVAGATEESPVEPECRMAAQGEGLGDVGTAARGRSR